MDRDSQDSGTSGYHVRIEGRANWLDISHYQVAWVDMDEWLGSRHSWGR